MALPAEQGYRTLLLDCDAQSDLSTVFLPGHEELPHSIADIFAGTMSGRWNRARRGS